MSMFQRLFTLLSCSSRSSDRNAAIGTSEGSQSHLSTLLSLSPTSVFFILAELTFLSQYVHFKIDQLFILCFSCFFSYAFFTAPYVFDNKYLCLHVQYELWKQQPNACWFISSQPHCTDSVCTCWVNVKDSLITGIIRHHLFDCHTLKGMI